MDKTVIRSDWTDRRGRIHTKHLDIYNIGSPLEIARYLDKDAFSDMLIVLDYDI